MSISPFHGGLVFRENLIDSDYPTQIEDIKSAVSKAAGVTKADNNLNEFFNPNVSTLTL